MSDLIRRAAVAAGAVIVLPAGIGNPRRVNIGQVSDLRLGVPARVTLDHAPAARGLEPRRVEHLQLHLTWDVTGILDRWAHPGRAEDAMGKSTLIKWWLLRVYGPLPGCPAERGEFIMEASLYGDPPGWWITVGA